VARIAWALASSGGHHMITLYAWCEAVARRWGRPALIVFTFLLACFLSYKAVHNQLTETQVLGEGRVSISAYLEGTASRPFAHRVLTPMLIRVVRDGLHMDALIAAAPTIAQDKISSVCAKATAEPPVPCGTVMAYATVAGLYFLCFLGVMWLLAMRMFDNSTIVAFGCVVLSFLAVNALILLRLSHIYDFGVLMFAALLLLCLEYRKHFLFCVVLVFACLNKESAILYTLAFACVNLHRLPIARNAAYCAVQIASFAIVYGGVRFLFRNNPGQGLELYLFGQISFFSEKYTLAYLLWTLPLVAVVFYDFPRKNETLQRAGIVLLPWFALYVIGGVPREIRVIFEVLPLLLLLATGSLTTLVLGRAITDERAGAGTRTV